MDAFQDQGGRETTRDEHERQMHDGCYLYLPTAFSLVLTRKRQRAGVTLRS